MQATVVHLKHWHWVTQLECAKLQVWQDPASEIMSSGPDSPAVLSCLVFALKEPFSSSWSWEAPANIYSGSSPVENGDSAINLTTALTGPGSSWSALGHLPIPEPVSWAKECKLFISPAILRLLPKKILLVFLGEGGGYAGQTKSVDSHCLCSMAHYED